MLIARDITWDTDGEELDLPHNVVLTNTNPDKSIADRLSDMYDFCVISIGSVDEVATFLGDEEKMDDFFRLSKEEFLQSYSYLTEDEYDCTEIMVKNYAFKAQQPLEVETAAGILRAYKTTNPHAPGISVMLQPAAYDEEIDVCLAEVVDTPDYGKSYTGNPMDVGIVIWGDATTEEYTSKEVLRREDVLAGFGSAAHA